MLDEEDMKQSMNNAKDIEPNHDILVERDAVWPERPEQQRIERDVQSGKQYIPLYHPL